MKFICKVCLKSRVKQIQGKRPGTKINIYVDQLGRRWNGRCCPQCKWDEVKKRLSHKKKTGQDLSRVYPDGVSNSLYGPKSAPIGRVRDCQSCGTSTTNYYHCRACYTHMRTGNSAALSEAEFYDLHGGC